VGGRSGGVYWVPASTYVLLRLCGDCVKAEVGEGMAIGLAPGVTSYRRDDALLTGKRGEWVLDEAEVRREAWYARLGAWNAAEGEGGAEMVGEEEVSMSRLQTAGALLVVPWSWLWLWSWSWSCRC
jgi:hypothetical protein